MEQRKGGVQLRIHCTTSGNKPPSMNHLFPLLLTLSTVLNPSPPFYASNTLIFTTAVLLSSTISKLSLLLTRAYDFLLEDRLARRICDPSSKHACALPQHHYLGIEMPPLGRRSEDAARAFLLVSQGWKHVTSATIGGVSKIEACHLAVLSELPNLSSILTSDSSCFPSYIQSSTFAPGVTYQGNFSCLTKSKLTLL